MWNNWFFLMDLDRGPPYILPVGPIPSNSQGLGGPLFSQFNSLVDNSIQKSIQGAFNTMSKLTGDLVFLFTHASSSNLSQRISAIQNGSNSLGNRFFTAVNHGTPTQNNVAGFCFGFGSREELSAPMVFGNISNFIFKLLLREAEKLQSFSVLSFAAALVPPFDNLPTNALAVSPGNDGVQVHASLDQRPCQVDHQGCSRLGFYDLKRTRLAIEPRTGIEFPLILDNLLTEENTNLNSEVLVGTGSRTMKIIRIKSLKVYAFGFYVHPDSLCKKLGWKYGSIPPGELNKCRDFYEDLLREDIDMTVRLVINCNGMKINTVRDAFEKSLRARLQKTNPNTDYHCLRTFGSMFTKDIPLPAGTTVDFRQTAKGLFITEIEGNKIGTVDSKDLCRAFFDMYIGDVPVSEQAKQEIANNVGTIIRKC